MGTGVFGQVRAVRSFWVSILLLILILVAVTLRLWRLDALPPGLYADEAFNGLDVRRFSREDTCRSTLPQTMDGSRSSSICRLYRYGS
jgi:hypothetical protein